MSNIPVLSWPSCLTVHLTGAALQEFRTLQRATPDISFQHIVDSFKRPFVVCDEQKGLRALIQSQRLVDFRDLGTFVGEYKRLVSFVEVVTCPAELIADWLVASLEGSPAAAAITQLTLTRGVRPPLPDLLASLTTLAQIGSPSRLPPSTSTAPAANLTGWASQPKPPVVPPARPNMRPGRPCTHCSGAHFDRFCPKRPARAPSRPCKHCNGEHWDIDCPDGNRTADLGANPAKRPRPTPPLMITAGSTSAGVPRRAPAVLLTTPNNLELDSPPLRLEDTPADDRYMYDQDTRFRYESDQFTDPSQPDAQPGALCHFGEELQNWSPGAFTVYPTHDPTALLVKDPFFQAEILVPVNANGVTFENGLLDTGCQLTIVSLEVARQLQLPVQRSKITIEVADNRLRPVAGTSLISIAVGNSRVIHLNALVFDSLRYSFLIGLDFLMAACASISLGNGLTTITFRNDAIPPGAAVARASCPGRLVPQNLRKHQAVVPPVNVIKARARCRPSTPPTDKSDDEAGEM